jgi:hypothetical protein
MSPSGNIVVRCDTKRAGSLIYRDLCSPKARTHQSWSTTWRSELWTSVPPLYSMKPNFLKLFMKKLARERVVPTISAKVS